MINTLCKAITLALLIMLPLSSSYGSGEGEIKLPLVHITNSVETSYTWFGIIIDSASNDIVAMYKDRFSDEKDKTPEHFLYELSDIAYDEGVAISSRKGIDIVKVSCDNFEPAYGGVVTLTFFKNLIKKKKKSVELEVLREDNRWTIIHNGKKVKKMFFKANKKMGVVYGIKKIVFTYEKS